MKISKYFFIFIFSFFSVSIFSTLRPNVVIILVDDLGWADISYRGAPFNTPNIDSLFKDGVSLNRFYTTPICSPTRAALMTGRDPLKLGVAYSVIMPWMNNGIHTDEHFMPQSFKLNGYQTGMFGKWHLGHSQETFHPNQRGFDYFYGHLHTEVGYFSPFSNQGGIDFQRNGKTIEVMNTDAEGRLIMADALAFASESKPDIICDVATLTGAAYVALGVEIGAVFSNNKVTLESFLSSNNDGFENYHSLPLEQRYKSLIKSNIADMKNSGGRFGGAITAALLLEEFVDDLNWVHLDIAGPARSRSSNSIYPEGGTGFGVLGFFNFLTNESNS